MAHGNVWRMIATLIARLRHNEFAWTFLWVSGARIGTLLFSMLGTVLIYRVLASTSGGMAEAGHFAIAMAVVRILTSCIGGTSDLVVLRRVPVLIHSDRARAGEVVRASFVLRAGALALVLVVALLLKRVFAEVFLDGAAEAPLVLLMVAAAAGELLLRSVLTLFQATERFDRFVMFEGGFQFARLACVAGLYGAGALSVAGVLGFYAICGLGVAAAAWQRMPRGLLVWDRVPAGVLRESFVFFAWTIAGFIVVASTERADLFMLSRYLGVDQVGTYGGVLALAVIPDYVGGLLGTVLQPRVVRLREAGTLLAFHRRLVLGMLPVVVVGMLVLLAIADPLIGLLLGPKFLTAVPSFLVLAAGACAWLLLSPVSAVLITLTAPRITMVLCLVQLVVMVGAGMVLIPAHGILGAAAAVAGTRALLGVVVFTIGEWLMRRPAAA